MEIRAALRRAEAVYEAFRAAARVGGTERELETAVLNTAGDVETRFDLITGPRTAEVEGGATDRVLRAGDPLLLDLCLRQGEHWCDVCRTFFLGRPQEEAAQAYAKVLDGFSLVRSLLRPGAQAAALYCAAERYFAIAGMPGWMRHHTGHGIGRTPFEAPVERPDTQDVVREGDVVTVEIGLYSGERFGIRVEDDFLVTARGAEPLWDYPKTLDSAILSIDPAKEGDWL